MDETKITAAERAWQQRCAKLRASARELEKDCQGKLQTFRGYADKDFYKAEMNVLGKRLEWLSAILDSRADKLGILIAQQKSAGVAKARTERGVSSAASEAQTTPDDLMAMGRAPPCPSWMSMVTIMDLQNMGDFQGCRSQKDIREKNEALKRPRADVQSLISAAKAASNDLSTAKKRADINRKKEQEKAKKMEEKKKAAADEEVRPRKKRSGASSRRPPLLNLDLCSVDVPSLTLRASDADAWDSRFLLQPWVFRGSDILDPQDPDLKDFATVFKNSSLRVTEGQASRKLGEACQSSFCRKAEDALENRFKVGPALDGAGAWDPVLAKGSLAPAFFGMVGHHCSVAKFEAAMAPMMKYISTGTVLVSMWVPRALVFPSEVSGSSAEGAMMTSDFQAAALKATEEDIKEAGNDIYMCTRELCAACRLGVWEVNPRIQADHQSSMSCIVQ